MIQLHSVPALTRLCMQLTESPTGCWLWTGINGGKGECTGYGNFTLNGKNIGAHRAAWELLIGPVPAGLCVLHECDTRRCCHPFHLYTGDKKQNRADFMARHPRAKELVAVVQLIGTEALRSWWSNMKPSERSAFIDRRTAAKAAKRKAKL